MIARFACWYWEGLTARKRVWGGAGFGIVMGSVGYWPWNVVWIPAYCLLLWATSEIALREKHKHWKRIHVIRADFGLS